MSQRPCPHPGCDYSVNIRLCRGTKVPEHKGLWYEACTAPPPTSHFVGWVRERGIGEVLPFPTPTTFQQALLQVPRTPHKVLPFNKLGNSPNTPSCSRSQISVSPSTAAGVAAVARAADAAEELEKARAAELLVSALENYNNLPNLDSGDVDVNDQPDNIDDDVLLTQTIAATGPVTPSKSQSTVSPELKSTDAIWPHEHTRRIVKAGKAIIACNGPICFNNVAKGLDSFQKDGAKPCAQASHSVSGTQSTDQSESEVFSGSKLTGISTASGVRLTNGSGNSYNGNLPLRQIHYERSQQAREKYQIGTNRLVQQKAIEETMKSSVTIFYWKNDGKHTTFRIPCSSYPVFTLAGCSAGILKILGLYDDESDKLIEAFDPVNNTWQIHMLETAQDVSKVPRLLYRALENVSDMAEGMEEETNLLVNWVQPRKRHIELATEPCTKKPRMTPSSSKTPIAGTSQIQETPTRLKLKQHPIAGTSQETPSRHIGHLRSPVKSESDHALSDSDSSDLPSPSEIRKTLVPQTKSKSQARKKVAVLPNRNHKRKYQSSDPGTDSNSDSEVEIAATAPSSRHAPWPFKYVCAMAEGFNKMETMEGMGDLPSRFTAAFKGIPFPSSKATFFAAQNLWLAADEELKDAYIHAKTTPEGLWKAFRKDVLAEYGGKLPSRRELISSRRTGSATETERVTKGKGKEKISRGKVIGKDDTPGLKIKKEPEVIVLDISD
ncbi:hypothetical protein JR316_0011537 [Psilocybe cubensis]|uniref:Uncharacterized protein n=1 Tax=Psilocybe cubensis TaxID=181762 RepID=A0ACB8GKQ7_PSICU|nr:hypothetical protein JR316_0011537 [Psilocybe cubensis]KAH9475972.1 hypothetical protein JR316_0011537 [Psilocybe cubensis]